MILVTIPDPVLNRSKRTSLKESLSGIGVIAPHFTELGEGRVAGIVLVGVFQDVDTQDTQRPYGCTGTIRGWRS